VTQSVEQLEQAQRGMQELQDERLVQQAEIKAARQEANQARQEAAAMEGYCAILEQELRGTPPEHHQALALGAGIVAQEDKVSNASHQARLGQESVEDGGETLNRVIETLMSAVPPSPERTLLKRMQKDMRSPAGGEDKRTSVSPIALSLPLFDAVTPEKPERPLQAGQSTVFATNR
jgi:hypothetical protein